jgi:hypothetical protein
MRSALARMFASKNPRGADRVTAVLTNWISVASTVLEKYELFQKQARTEFDVELSPRHR